MLKRQQSLSRGTGVWGAASVQAAEAVEKEETCWGGGQGCSPSILMTSMYECPGRVCINRNRLFNSKVWQLPPDGPPENR